ncbi:MAG: DUF2783 domain-containing protein [Hyphomicrobiaceae bacterium]|nr:DUF2783 domain-containing protein [Hyphomicrobiaceae bacterium]
MSEPALDTSFRLGAGGDDVYAALVEAHRGLSEEASHRLNVRLVLLLANQVGCSAAVKAAIARACHGLETEP